MRLLTAKWHSTRHPSSYHLTLPLPYTLNLQCVQAVYKKAKKEIYDAMENTTWTAQTFQAQGFIILWRSITKKTWICPICHSAEKKPKLDDTAISPINDCFSHHDRPIGEVKRTGQKRPNRKLANKSLTFEDFSDLEENTKTSLSRIKDKILNEP